MKKPLNIATRLVALAIVPFSLIAQPQKADALLSFYIFEQGSTTKIKTIGSLNLPATPYSTDSASCYTAGFNLFLALLHSWNCLREMVFPVQLRRISLLA